MACEVAAVRRGDVVRIVYEDVTIFKDMDIPSSPSLRVAWGVVQEANEKFLILCFEKALIPGLEEPRWTGILIPIQNILRIEKFGRAS